MKTVNRSCRSFSLFQETCCLSFIPRGDEHPCSLKSLSGWRWRSQLVIVGASSAPPWPKGFTGAEEPDKAGFKVKIKQKNLPGRNPALTRQKNRNATDVPAFWLEAALLAQAVLALALALDFSNYVLAKWQKSYSTTLELFAIFEK